MNDYICSHHPLTPSPVSTGPPSTRPDHKKRNSNHTLSQKSKSRYSKSKKYSESTNFLKQQKRFCVFNHSENEFDIE